MKKTTQHLKALKPRASLRSLRKKPLKHAKKTHKTVRAALPKATRISRRRKAPAKSYTLKTKRYLKSHALAMTEIAAASVVAIVAWHFKNQLQRMVNFFRR